jgi:glycosyltransferase involved in cell wall biosynthesis
MGKTIIRRALVHNPYWDSMGGGERYCASVVKVLLDAGWEVALDWYDQTLPEKLEERFGVGISQVKIIDKHHKGWGCDLCFWVSDGSVPLLFSKKNLLHMQIPFHGVGGEKWLNQQKLKRIHHVICNSNFTKAVIDQEFKVTSDVIYPPVDVAKFHAGEKEKIILYVGRFSQLKQNKNQEFLIDFFKGLSRQSAMLEWKLVLAGGSGVGDGGFLNQLKKEAQGLKVDFVENPAFQTLVDLYARAKIFWSAAGFGSDENTSPETVEHFGITLVEAMASGCIPVVFNGGGHKEIVSNEFGFLWSTKEELEKIFLQIIDGENTDIFLSQKAIEKSRNYDLSIFEKHLVELLKI